jgi:hypothetical protein
VTIKTDSELDALVVKHVRPNCAQTSFLAMREALGLDVDSKDFEQALTAAVSGEFGSTRCGEIIEGYYGKRVDMTDPEQVQAYIAAGGQAHCLSVIRASVKAAKDLIDESAVEECELQPT